MILKCPGKTGPNRTQEESDGISLRPRVNTKPSKLVGWMFVPLVSSALLRAELGYPAATAILCALLYILYRQAPRADGDLVPARRSVEDVIEGSGGIILTEDR